MNIDNFGALIHFKQFTYSKCNVSNDANRIGKLAQTMFIFKSSVNVTVIQNENNNNSNTVSGFQK